MKTYEPLAGTHIREAITEALALAVQSGEVVSMTFNDTDLSISPTDTADALVDNWTTNREAERIAASQCAGPTAVASEDSQTKEGPVSPTEQEMRDSSPAWPKTIEELTTQINALVDRPHDYGTCVYAMSLSAVAAFHYVAHKLGVTGFQASCADMDILKRTRSIAGPFMILKIEDSLYPQYDLPAKLREFLTECAPWLKEQAAKKLADPTTKTAHPEVLAHWRKLAGIE